MSKQYAHLYTMAKTSVKFQNDWPKTVGGVALTRNPLTIFVCVEVLRPSQPNGVMSRAVPLTIRVLGKN